MQNIQTKTIWSITNTIEFKWPIEKVAFLAWSQNAIYFVVQTLSIAFVLLSITVISISCVAQNDVFANSVQNCLQNGEQQLC